MNKLSVFKSLASLSYFGFGIFALFVSSRQPSNGVIDHFRIGDVVHSILEPTDFKALHGDSWRLMNGDQLEDGVDLKKYYGTKFPSGNLPDSRGLFIRGMNEGRNDGNQDPDITRKVGIFQKEEFKSHDHDVKFLDRTGDIVGFHTTNGNSDQIQRLTWGDRAPYGGAVTDITIVANGGAETRPNNIALYIYIKVNE